VTFDKSQQSPASQSHHTSTADLGIIATLSPTSADMQTMPHDAAACLTCVVLCDLPAN
jgi:hypothetical protein